MKKIIITILLFIIGGYDAKSSTIQCANECYAMLHRLNTHLCDNMSLEHMLLDTAIVWEQIMPDNIVEGDKIYSKYKIELFNNSSSSNFNILIDNKIYKTTDILDYGELDLIIYKKEKQTLFLIGLNDYYESVFYVYYLSNDKLARLGYFSVTQSDDVEVTGLKSISFKVTSGTDSVHIYKYLDNISCGIEVFNKK